METSSLLSTLLHLERLTTTLRDNVYIFSIESKYFHKLLLSGYETKTISISNINCEIVKFRITSKGSSKTNETLSYQHIHQVGFPSICCVHIKFKKRFFRHRACCFYSLLLVRHDKTTKIAKKLYPFAFFILYAHTSRIALDFELSQQHFTKTVCVRGPLQSCKCSLPNNAKKDIRKLNAKDKFSKDRNDKSKPSRPNTKGFFSYVLRAVCVILTIASKIDQRKYRAHTGYKKALKPNHYGNSSSACLFMNQISLFLTYAIFSNFLLVTDGAILISNFTTVAPSKFFYPYTIHIVNLNTLNVRYKILYL